MSSPQLTPEQQEAVQQEAEKQAAAVQNLQNAAQQQQEKIEQLELVEDSYKVFFEFYNEGVIQKYDEEKRALEGSFIENPITEQDIQDVGSLQGRLLPTLPETDIIRIDEFDGQPLETDPDNEIVHINDQSFKEEVLVNGYNKDPIFSEDAETTTAIDSTSTSVSISDATGPMEFNEEDIFAVISTTDVALIRVLEILNQTANSAELSIEFIVTPDATISSGSSLEKFEGFNNTERSAKDAQEIPQFQKIMDYLIGRLEEEINNRIDRLNEQETALQGNLDPDGETDNNTALQNIEDSRTFLTDYLQTTDISDTGLNSLETERISRLSEINDRITQIQNAYTNQTENYYDRRYNIANSRGNTFRGSLRLLKGAGDSVENTQTYADDLQESVNDLNSLLE